MKTGYKWAIRILLLVISNVVCTLMGVPLWGFFIGGVIVGLLFPVFGVEFEF